MAAPRAVHAEHGMDVPDGMNVDVDENTDNTADITISATPRGARKLSDQELPSAAKGPATHFVTRAKVPGADRLMACTRSPWSASVVGATR